MRQGDDIFAQITSMEEKQEDPTGIGARQYLQSTRSKTIQEKILKDYNDANQGVTLNRVSELERQNKVLNRAKNSIARKNINQEARMGKRIDKL